MLSGILYFIIVNIKVIIKNAKTPVAGLGGVADEFVVGNVLGDCSCASVGGGAIGSPVLGSVGIVGGDDDDMICDTYIYYLLYLLYFLCIICIN
jgi:hypothetical protein